MLDHVVSGELDRRGVLLLALRMTWNFFVVNNFFSTFAVLDIRRTRNIWLLIQLWMLHLCMHHAGYEHCLRNDIWFGGQVQQQIEYLGILDLQDIPCSNLLKSV